MDGHWVQLSTVKHSWFVIGLEWVGTEFSCQQSNAALSLAWDGWILSPAVYKRSWFVTRLGWVGTESSCQQPNSWFVTSLGWVGTESSCQQPNSWFVTSLGGVGTESSCQQSNNSFVTLIGHGSTAWLVLTLWGNRHVLNCCNHLVVWNILLWDKGTFLSVHFFTWDR